LIIFNELDSILLKQPTNKFFSASEQDLHSLDYVLSVSKNHIVYAHDYVEPNDTHYDKLWAKPTMRLPQTWRDNIGSKRTRVAVLDTGIDDTHPDLSDNISSDGYNFIDDNKDTMDVHGHGTHVAGTIGAVANNSRGVAGVMWDVEIIPVKVMRDDGSGTSWDIAKGILYAAGLKEDNKIERADVINMSLGGGGYSSTRHDAVKRAEEEGVILVASSGNDGSQYSAYPARYEEVIAVGALTDEGENSPPSLAWYSNYGDALEITAPGTSILSTIPDGVYQYKSGTSMAAPQISGVVGLMISEGIHHSDIRDILEKTAIELGDEYYYGAGMANAYWAVNNVNKININFSELETSINLQNESFTLEGEVKKGTHKLEVWIDVRGNGVLENGDYYYEETININRNGIYEVDVVLEEFLN